MLRPGVCAFFVLYIHSPSWIHLPHVKNVGVVGSNIVFKCDETKKKNLCGLFFCSFEFLLSLFQSMIFFVTDWNGLGKSVTYTYTVVLA